MIAFGSFGQLRYFKFLIISSYPSRKLIGSIWCNFFAKKFSNLFLVFLNTFNLNLFFVTLKLFNFKSLYLKNICFNKKLSFNFSSLGISKFLIK